MGVGTTADARASLLALPTELRDRILHYVFLERVPVRIPVKGTPTLIGRATTKDESWNQDMYWDPGQGTWRLQDPKRNVTEKPKAYLLPGNGEVPYRLFSKAPIAQVNKVLRAEVSRFLPLASIDIVTQVEKFDFSHIQTFCATLPASRLNDFVVQEDGNSTCALTVYISRPPDGSLGRSSANLESWLKFIHTSFPFPGMAPELATSYRLFRSPFAERVGETLSTLPLLQMMYNKHEGRDPGPGKLDLYKIMHTWWARWRIEGYLIDGWNMARHASPNDLKLPGVRNTLHRLWPAM
ncbi:uncharacterized protein RHO25_007016 [Cercospora beticola]|uniref:F-box domain-containing protein n=1 Tax=Cercospora beticola TaxID=122368 RepID=A0ABZ0NS21_CERBT|nr:hypothetical protein RHO25_007016 [Cercospora beticola]CAK1362731.1 unnamed protein product [Cercospora beticola]